MHEVIICQCQIKRKALQLKFTCSFFKVKLINCRKFLLTSQTKNSQSFSYDNFFQFY
jgi:hypothetical protein